MWDGSDDILDLETTPEMHAAAELLSKAGETVAMETLPLKKAEALCSMKCFNRIDDPWSLSVQEKEEILRCIEKCEEPMEIIGEVIEDERNKMLEMTTSCLERCNDNDESCANRCISQTISAGRINQMMERVRTRISSFRY
jgi:hypothetical protein